MIEFKAVLCGYMIYIIIFKEFIGTINSLWSTSSTFAISNRVSSKGCALLVHHLETVAES